MYETKIRSATVRNSEKKKKIAESSYRHYACSARQRVTSPLRSFARGTINKTDSWTSCYSRATLYTHICVRIRITRRRYFFEFWDSSKLDPAYLAKRPWLRKKLVGTRVHVHADNGCTYVRTYRVLFFPYNNRENEWRSYFFPSLTFVASFPALSFHPSLVISAAWPQSNSELFRVFHRITPSLHFLVIIRSNRFCCRNAGQVILERTNERAGNTGG